MKNVFRLRLQELQLPFIPLCVTAEYFWRPDHSERYQPGHGRGWETDHGLSLIHIYVADYYQEDMRHKEQEQFRMMMFNTRQVMLGEVLLTQGLSLIHISSW